MTAPNSALSSLLPMMSQPMSDFAYPYLHGFASSPQSNKGTSLRKTLKHDGVELDLLDLNVPRFAELTYTAALGVLDRYADSTDRPIRVAGSSMGGYLTALWASKNPERVESIFLLCPGFDLASRWPEMLESGALELWEERGSHPFEDGSGEVVELHWEFIRDARTHAPWPEVECPVRIVHGRADDVVPIALSRRYADRPNVELVEVGDDHSLADSLDTIAAQMRDFWKL